jgi:hypothetical protein
MIVIDDTSQDIFIVKASFTIHNDHHMMIILYSTYRPQGLYSQNFLYNLMILWEGP